MRGADCGKYLAISSIGGNAGLFKTLVLKVFRNRKGLVPFYMTIWAPLFRGLPRRSGAFLFSGAEFPR
jgi:hypothetical protein